MNMTKMAISFQLLLALPRNNDEDVAASVPKKIGVFFYSESPDYSLYIFLDRGALFEWVPSPLTLNNFFEVIIYDCK